MSRNVLNIVLQLSTTETRGISSVTLLHLVISSINAKFIITFPIYLNMEALKLLVSEKFIKLFPRQGKLPVQLICSCLLSHVYVGASELMSLFFFITHSSPLLGGEGAQERGLKQALKLTFPLSSSFYDSTLFTLYSKHMGVCLKKQRDRSKADSSKMQFIFLRVIHSTQPLSLMYFLPLHLSTSNFHFAGQTSVPP